MGTFAKYHLLPLIAIVVVAMLAFTGCEEEIQHVSREDKAKQELMRGISNRKSVPPGTIPAEFQFVLGKWKSSRYKYINLPFESDPRLVVDSNPRTIEFTDQPFDEEYFKGTVFTSDEAIEFKWKPDYLLARSEHPIADEIRNSGLSRPDRIIANARRPQEKGIFVIGFKHDHPFYNSVFYFGPLSFDKHLELVEQQDLRGTPSTGHFLQSFAVMAGRYEKHQSAAPEDDGTTPPEQ